jgi:hypothetical protein
VYRWARVAEMGEAICRAGEDVRVFSCVAVHTNQYEFKDTFSLSHLACAWLGCAACRGTSTLMPHRVQSGDELAFFKTLSYHPDHLVILKEPNEVRKGFCASNDSPLAH